MMKCIWNFIGSTKEYTEMNYKNRSERAEIALMVCVLLVLFVAGCKEVGTTPEEKQFDYKRIELDNGLDVVTLEDFSTPIVSVQVWYKVGSKDEQPDRQGFAHMFEHMMFRETEVLGPAEHQRHIRNVGGTSNGYTSFDRTVYLQRIPANQMELALWLEAERMAFLKIDQQSFDIERKVVEEERRMRLNRPYGSMLENLMEEIYKVHPYRWAPIGKISHLRAADVQELRDFWQRYYVPNNAVLIIVGAVEHEDAQQAAEKYFGWLPRYGEPKRVTVKEPRQKKARSVTLVEDNAPAPIEAVVYRTVALKHKDTRALDILSEILGGGRSSRLFRELVAQKQLAVSAEAYHWSFEQDGFFAAEVTMPPSGVDANNVLEIIESHIEKLRTEPVSERELSKAKNQMLRDLVTRNLKIESKARMLGSAALEYGDISQVNRHLEDIRTVTAQDIMRVANEYLSSNSAIKFRVNRNVSGVVSEKRKAEEQSLITAEPEKVAPKPGRAGLERGDDFAKEPPIGKVSSVRLTPNYSSEVLENGLKVLVVPNNEVPFITVQLGLLSGAWTEQKTGAASMAMRMLLKGTSKHTEEQLADELETYAIGVSGVGKMDTCTVNMSCLTEQLERGMKFLGEVVLEPIFPEDEFEKLRKQVLTSLTISSQKPEYLADKEFRRRLYEEHPYSRTATGEIVDVNALTIEDLKQWWEEFARPDMAVLIFSGDIEHERGVELAKQAFGGWRAVGEKPVKKLPQLKQPTQTQIYLVDKPDSIQSQIRIGQRGITRHTKEYFISRVVSSYFGWGANSRLSEYIREEKGLTYGVWGSYIAKRFAGRFEVNTFSKTESTAEAVKAVLEEIGRLKTQGPNKTELENNKSYILGNFMMARETPQQVASDLWMIESQQLGADYLERLVDGIANATEADCENLVAKTLESKEMVIVVVGQAEKLKEPLEQIAPVTIIPAGKQN